MAGTWCKGDVVALRELWRGRVWKARPWIVVRDRPDELVLWIPRGTPTKVPPGSGIPRDEWTLEDGTFQTDALRVTAPGASHSLLHFFEDGAFTGWYVNLERPLTRSAVGFDYLDLELDVRVEPKSRARTTRGFRPLPWRARDLKHPVVSTEFSWRLEDEDELAEAVRVGVLEPREAAELRAEALRVIQSRPWPTGWEDFRPNSGWPVPELPPGWDVVA